MCVCIVLNIMCSQNLIVHFSLVNTSVSKTESRMLRYARELDLDGPGRLTGSIHIDVTMSRLP